MSMTITCRLQGSIVIIWTALVLELVETDLTADERGLAINESVAAPCP